jgi:sulfoxide reductase heme-binding subunit YedZ
MEAGIMTLWYTARGAALAAVLMLTAATALGALGSIQSTQIGTRVLLQYAHRTAAALGLGLVAVHVVAILADADAGVGVRGAIVPFAADYRPNTVALGSIALYLFLFVAATGVARRRLARSPRAARIWRSTHLLAYVAWISAIGHGFLTGTDSGLLWVRSLYLVCLATVLAALTLRLAAQVRLRSRWHPSAPTVSAPTVNPALEPVR